MVRLSSTSFLRSEFVTQGGAGTVHRVLLFKWSKLTGNRVKLQSGSSWERESDVNRGYFPRPALAAAVQHIAITKGQLFGPAILAGRNPNDTFNLSLEQIILH